MITRDEKKVLHFLSRNEKKSIGSIVRFAINMYYGKWAFENGISLKK
jgi:hypothetical protein